MPAYSERRTSKRCGGTTPAKWIEYLKGQEILGWKRFLMEIFIIDKAVSELSYDKAELVWAKQIPLIVKKYSWECYEPEITEFILDYLWRHEDGLSLQQVIDKHDFSHWYLDGGK